MGNRVQISSFIVLLILPLLAAGLAGCQNAPTASPSSDHSPVQPYKGLQERNIAALSPERVSDLLTGRGAGYALAAELNHYPGPTHVLELEAQIELSPEQQDTVASIKAAMQQEAIQLGGQLVNLEENLNRGFRSGTITPEELESLTSEIAKVEGRLRNTHLQAHLQTVAMLTAEQVLHYDALRGYVSSDEASAPSADEHDTHGTQH